MIRLFELWSSPGLFYPDPRWRRRARWLIPALLAALVVQIIIGRLT